MIFKFSRQKVLGIVAAHSIFINSSTMCWAQSSSTLNLAEPPVPTLRSKDQPEAILALEVAPSSLPSSSELAAKVPATPSPDLDKPEAILALDAAPASLPTAAELASTATSGLHSALQQPSTPEAILAVDGPSANAAVPTATPAPPKENDQLLADLPDQGLLRGGVTSEPYAAQRRVDDLTKQILLKLIELERFNMHYTMEVAKQGRWKGWRYAAFQEVNAGMGLTGAIIGTAERGTHLHNAKRVHAAMMENANFIPMIGSIIGASAAALEFTINEYHDYQARTKGFAPKAAMNHVQGLKNDINKLLAEREALTKIESAAPTLMAHAEVDDCEAKVLKDLRDQALQEFERFHIGARKILAFQQMQYFFDFAKYTTNAIGYDFAYLSLHRHRRVWNGRAGVMWAVSGPLYMAGPIVSRVFAKGVGEMHRHLLRPTVEDAEASKLAALESDHALLDKMCKDTRIAPDMVTSSVDRSAMYGTHEKIYEDEITAAQKKNAAAKLSATQNIGAGLYVGATKTAQGILFMVPGYNHHYNINKNARADHVTNDELFIGSVISIPATMFAMIDTLRIQVKGELNRHKMAKAGMLPGQLANARLKQLDDMEQRLKSK